MNEARGHIRKIPEKLNKFRVLLLLNGIYLLESLRKNIRGSTFAQEIILYFWCFEVPVPGTLDFITINFRKFQIISMADRKIALIYAASGAPVFP